MELAEKIKESAQAKLPSDQFIVEVLYSGKKSPSRLLIIVDGDKGVTIDQCAELSRQLSQELDETNLIEGAFNLEISTPGLDHPLKLRRQYFKNVGRQFKVHLKDKKIIQGKLVEVTDEWIGVECELKEGKKKVLTKVEISFEEIEKAFVIVSFK
jgi:ribosome maturation factor RimP